MEFYSTMTGCIRREDTVKLHGSESLLLPTTD